MGKLSRGILGPIVGKVGNVIGSTWKGINYLRAMPTSVYNPRTPLQLSQRARFLTVLNFLKPILAFIKFGYQAYAIRKSAFNAAMSYFLHNAVTGIFPDFSIDFTKALVTRGNLRPVDDVSLSAPTTLQLQLDWDPSDELGDPNDRIMVLVYNDAKGLSRYNLGSAIREDGFVTVTMPEDFLGDQVHVWVSTTSLPDLTSTSSASTISDSTYAGSITVI